MEGIGGKAFLQAAVRPYERHQRIAPDAGSGPFQGCIHGRGELVVVQNVERAIGVGACQNGGDHILGRKHPFSGAKLGIVPLGHQGELAGDLPIEHHFGRYLPFCSFVPEAIGDVAAQPDEFREILGGAAAQLQPEALRLVLDDGAGPSAYLEACAGNLVIAADEGACQGVSVFIEAGLLELLHHVEDALLAGFQGNGSKLRPKLFVSLLHISLHHQVLGREGILVLPGAENGLFKVNLSPPQERDYPGGIAGGDGKVYESGSEVYDGIVVCRLTSNEQKLLFRAYDSNGETTERIISLDGLIFTHRFDVGFIAEDNTTIDVSDYDNLVIDGLSDEELELKCYIEGGETQVVTESDLPATIDVSGTDSVLMYCSTHDDYITYYLTKE